MDSQFHIDSERLSAIQDSLPWIQDPRFFKNVSITLSTVMKMTSHASKGIEEGIKSPSKIPFEIMGLLCGHIDTANLSGPPTIVITDAFPLPVVGTETAVLGSDDNVVSYMTELSSNVDFLGGSSLIGWYHSHPFEVGSHSNSYLSSTDVSTQSNWQAISDSNGTPWIALVIDPLRGLEKSEVEIGAFRTFPSTFTVEKNMAPNGLVYANSEQLFKEWGVDSSRYYSLKVDYIYPSNSLPILKQIARDRSSIASLADNLSIEESEIRKKWYQSLSPIGCEHGQESMSPSPLVSGSLSRFSTPTHFHSSISRVDPSRNRNSASSLETRSNICSHKSHSDILAAAYNAILVQKCRSINTNAFTLKPCQSEK